jgi:hypothetical protein
VPAAPGAPRNRIVVDDIAENIDRVVRGLLADPDSRSIDNIEFSIGFQRPGSMAASNVPSIITVTTDSFLAHASPKENPSYAASN